MIEREQLNLEQLASLTDVQVLAPLLGVFDAAAARSRCPAYEFAEQLRLPAYKWLSPHLAQHHTDDLVAQGGSKLGTKPRSMEARLQLPPMRKLALPRPDLSVREAFELITPFVRRFGSAWHLVRLFGGNLKQAGRLELRNGNWQFTYADPNGSSGDTVVVSLVFNGNLAFHAQSAVGAMASGRHATQSVGPDWLDSTDIAEIVLGEPRPEGIDEDYSLSMSLRPLEGAPLMWEVTRLSMGHPPGARPVRHVLAVDAATGAVVFETHEVREGRSIRTRLRRRWEGAEWEDMPASGDLPSDPETTR